MEGILQSASGRSLYVGKGLPDSRLWDGDPGVSCSPKIGIVVSPNMDSSFAHHHTWQAGLNQKETKTDKHRTLFVGSKYSPGTVLLKGIIYCKNSCCLTMQWLP